MNDNVITRNGKGNLNGEIECPVCKKKYIWEENINADAIVKNIDIDGKKVYINLEVTSKCPHCNYKTGHYHKERNDKIR